MPLITLIAGTAVPAEGGASRWSPVLASANDIQWTNSRQHYPAVKTPPACAWSAPSWYGSLAVEVFWRAPCTVLAAQASFYDSISAPGKTIRTKRQLQSCISLQVSANNVSWRLHVGQLVLSVFSLRDAKGLFWWFHQKMPGGNKEHQPLALYHFDIDVHLRKFSILMHMLNFRWKHNCCRKQSLLPSWWTDWLVPTSLY